MCGAFARNSIFALLLGFAAIAWATDDEPAKQGRWETGFHLGRLLPSDLPGVTEIMGLGGVRVGLRGAPFTYYEAGLIMGAARGVTWQNFHLDIRFDIPVEEFFFVAYLGADAIRYEATAPVLDSQGRRVVDFRGNPYLKQLHSNLYGAHIGGGIQFQFAGPIWMRADMKFNMVPSQILYISFALVWRL